jgi:hypothetical protein
LFEGARTFFLFSCASFEALVPFGIFHQNGFVKGIVPDSRIPSNGDFPETVKELSLSRSQFNSCVKKPELLSGFFIFPDQSGIDFYVILRWTDFVVMNQNRQK